MIVIIVEIERTSFTFNAIASLPELNIKRLNPASVLFLADSNIFGDKAPSESPRCEYVKLEDCPLVAKIMEKYVGD